MSDLPKPEEYTLAMSVNSNYLNRGWMTIYGILMRQAENNEDRKLEVIKACKRVLEDLEPSRGPVETGGKDNESPTRF